MSDLSVSSFPATDANLCAAEEGTSSQASLEARAAPKTDAVGSSSVCTTPNDESLENLNFQDSVETVSPTNSHAVLDRDAVAGQKLDLPCDELSRTGDGFEKDRDKHPQSAEVLQEAVNRLERVLSERDSELEEVRSECKSERAQRKILEARLAELSLPPSGVRDELKNRLEGSK